jgi:hypothetical protein
VTWPLFNSLMFSFHNLQHNLSNATMWCTPFYTSNSCHEVFNLIHPTCLPLCSTPTLKPLILTNISLIKSFFVRTNVNIAINKLFEQMFLGHITQIWLKYRFWSHEHVPNDFSNTCNPIALPIWKLNFKVRCLIMNKL